MKEEIETLCCGLWSGVKIEELSPEITKVVKRHCRKYKKEFFAKIVERQKNAIKYPMRDTNGLKMVGYNKIYNQAVKDIKKIL